jgi:hypothetical protein
MQIQEDDGYMIPGNDSAYSLLFQQGPLQCIK